MKEIKLLRVHCEKMNFSLKHEKKKVFDTYFVRYIIILLSQACNYSAEAKR